MTLKDPIHRLKKIKPKIHLFRDDAILELFREIYEIIDCVLKENENKDKEFLFIPISGMHLGGHTTEHFFLKGAPIGIFNMPEKESRVKSISGILTYSLYNRKVDLSATKVLNELEVGSSDKHIVSFGSFKTFENNKPIIQKNFKRYEYGEDLLWSEKLIDQLVWNDFFEEIKIIVDAQHNEETIFIIPDLDEQRDRLPFVQLANESNTTELFYISENIVQLGEKSGLKYNYYFPSLHFEMETDNDHSYGFMVVSTNQDANPGFEEHTNSLLQFFERLSLVTFSLVGIIEQHHYGKIQKWMGILESIYRHPEDLLGITQRPDYAAESKFLRLVNKRQNESDILKNASYKLYRLIENTIDKKNIDANSIVKFNGKNGSFKELFLWQNEDISITTQSIDELCKSSFVNRLFEFHHFINYTNYSVLSGGRVIRHCFESYNHAENKEGFWIENIKLFRPFEDLSIAKGHPDFLVCFWTQLQNCLIDRNIGTLSENGNGLQNLVSNIFHFFKNRRSITYHDYPLLKSDWEAIKTILLSNYERHVKVESNVEHEIFEIDSDWFVIKFKINPNPLNETQKEAIRNACNEKVYEIQHLNHLIYLITECYKGEVWHIVKSEAFCEFIQHKNFYENCLAGDEVPKQFANFEIGSYCLIVLPKHINSK